VLLATERMHKMPYPRNGLASRRALLVAALTAGAVLAGAGSVRAATLPTLSLTIKSGSITVGGSMESGAVNVIATAAGGKEPSAVLVQLKPGVSPGEFFSYLGGKGGKDPNNVSKFGSIAFDNEAAPAPGSEAQVNLVPGQYVALVIEGEGSPGAHAAFTVTAARSPVLLPTPAATESTIEFGFTGPKVLHDGEIVRFENEGFLVHMDSALRVKDMNAAKQLVKALLTGNRRAQNRLIKGGFGFDGPLSTGAFQQETITAKPGVYVQVCFMETQDKRDHALLGMERIIRITR
jgi:hypothetical protein